MVIHTPSLLNAAKLIQYLAPACQMSMWFSSQRGGFSSGCSVFHPHKLADDANENDLYKLL